MRDHSQLIEPHVSLPGKWGDIFPTLWDYCEDKNERTNTKHFEKLESLSKMQHLIMQIILKCLRSLKKKYLVIL